MFITIESKQMNLESKVIIIKMINLKTNLKWIIYLHHTKIQTRKTDSLIRFSLFGKWIIQRLFLVILHIHSLNIRGTFIWTMSVFTRNDHLNRPHFIGIY